jgi:uncharacterized membrane protein
MLSAILWLVGNPMVLRAAGTPVRYVAVAPIGSDSGNDCTRRYNPCATVRHAVDVAASNDEIRVAAGVYTGTVTLNKSLTLRGGFTTTNWATPDPDQNPTIMNAQGLGRVLYVDSPVSVTVSGFHLTGGNVSGMGGGVYNEFGQLTVVDCLIYGNNAAGGSGGGGGVTNGVVGSAATLILRDSRLYSNTAGSVGGGLDVVLGTVVVEACEILSNSAAMAGGGVAVVDGSATIRSSLVYRNRALSSPGDGGGIAVSMGTGVARLENSTVYSNEAASRGGGIYASGVVYVTNGLIISNVASVSLGGGGVYSGTGGLRALSSTDFFGNSPDHIRGPSGSIDPTTLGASNRITEPLFVDARNYDLHLATGSPAIDSGSDAPGVAVDYDGNGRPFGLAMDRGADEYTLAGPCYARLGSGRVYTDVQAAVDASPAGGLVQIAGRCAGIQVRDGLTQTVYVSRSLTLRGGYTVTNWTSPRYGPTVLDAQGLGRVLYLTGTSVIAVENLHIRGGSADYGAGVYVGSAVTATIQNNVIYRNDATVAGGGVYNDGGAAILQHDTIYSNTANRGAGICSAGQATLGNTLLVGNAATLDGGGVLTDTGGSFALSYNDFYANVSDNYGNVVTGATDISVPPGFVNPGASDFHLTLTSAVINRANPASSLATDFEGDFRPQGSRADIGADESLLFAEVDVGDSPDSPLIISDLDQVRGKTITFTHTITNYGDTGSGQDTFTLALANSGGWDVALLGVTSSLTLRVDESRVFSVVVTVPATVSVAYNRTTITATSTANAAVSDAAHDYIVRPGLEFVPDYTGNADPGEVVTYTHYLTNTGEGSDTFAITFDSSLGWLQQVTPTVVTLAPNETAPIYARVRVTDTAPAGLQDVTTLRATSSFGASVFVVVTDTTIANPTTGDRFVSKLGSDVNNNCTQQAPPCATIGYALNQAAWGDTIFVAQGTYNETDLLVNQDVSLRGGYNNGFTRPGGMIDPALTVIDAQSAGRGLRILVGAAYHPVIEGFTVRNASASLGGAVYVEASSSPTLTHLILVDSSATRGGGLYIDLGNPVLQDVVISTTLATGQGGGIYVNGGSPVFQGVRIFGARAGDGGGLYVAGGNVTVQGLRIVSNTATSRGGGVYQAGGTLALWNNFIYSNTALSGSGGGVYKAGGALSVVNDTLYANQAGASGGGVFDGGSGTLAITNTIVVSNSAASGGGIYSAGGSSLLDYNDVWHNTAASFPDSNVPTGAHSIAADPLFVDAAAGDLHIVSTSPCFDTADPNTFLRTDIDGDIRPSNQGFDIGADELAGCRVLNERTRVLYGMLQAAIDEAIDSDVLLVSGICRGASPRLVDGRIISQTAFISRTMAIRGGYDSAFGNDPDTNPVTTTIDAQGMGRAIVITGSVFANLSHLTLTGGDAAGLGGGPGGGDAGGGLYSYGNLLFVTSTVIISNRAAYGGGVYCSGGSPYVLDVSFEGNSAAQGGGAYNASTVTFSRTAFYSNTATSGGGVYNAGVGILLNGQAITAAFNLADNGGAFYNTGGARLYLQRGIVLSNTAGGDGGALYNTSTGILSVTNTLVVSNTAGGNGGGLYNLSDSLTVRHDTFYANRAGNWGGGVYHNGSTSAPVVNSTILANNTASSGGGIYSAGAAPQFDYNDVYGNSSVGVAGSGNIAADPRFVSTDPASSRFLRIPGGSPAEDTGDPNSPVADDIDGDPRPTNRSFDIGADEVGGCYVRVNGLPPTYGNIQRAIGRSVSGDEIRVAGVCQGVNAFVDGGQTVSQTIFAITRTLAVRGGYTVTNWTVAEPLTNPTVLDALGMGRVVYVAGSAVISVSDLHLRGGAAISGGAVFVRGGVLTMTGNLVYSNTATNGGGVYVQGGAAYVVRNQVCSNTASYGGAAYGAGGQLTLDGNDLRANQVITAGGGYYHAGGTAWVQNNIMRGNMAFNGGGVYNAGAGLAVRHNTFYSNTATTGGGLYNASGGPVVVSNIFITNTAATGRAVHSAVALVVDYNDVYPATSSYGGGASPGPNSLSVEPRLVSPAGGDFHVQDDSPVIDRGDPAMTLTHDFEGDLRPADQGFDIGADERKGCWARIVRTGVVYGNIQRAIDYSIPGDEIQVTLGECRGVHPYNDGGSIISQTVHVTHSLTLHGGFSRDFASGGVKGPDVYPDPLATTINPQGRGRAIFVAGGVTVTLQRFILINGNATGLGGGPGGAAAGGAFYYRGSAGQLEHVDFYTSAAAYGGAFYNAGDRLNMINSWINFNTATFYGGAIYNASGAITITLDELNEGTRVYSNTAGNRGGGIYNDSGHVSLLYNDVNIDPTGQAVLALNRANLGGFLYNRIGQVYAISNTISMNEALEGGAFYNEAGTLTLERNDISENVATSSSPGGGGGLFNAAGGTCILDLGNRFHFNDAQWGNGGAIHSSGVLTAWNTLIYRNTTYNQGGGIYVAGGSPSILHNTFYYNAASQPTSVGGAICVASSVPPLVKNNIFDSNSAPLGGSAIYAVTATLGYNDYYPGDAVAQVAGGVPVGTNNRNAYPQFVDPSAADFHLREGSDLIDRAQPGLGVTHDFEDDPRPTNLGPDMGADEYNDCLALLLSSNPAVNGHIYGRLQEALDNAMFGDTIQVAEGTCYESILIDKDITILGSWKKDFSDYVRTAEGYIIANISHVDASYTTNRVATIANTVSEASISRLVFQNSDTASNGGCILSQADHLALSIVGLDFCHAANGGGIYVSQGTVDMDRVWIWSNRADGDGGGIYAGANVTVTFGASIWNNEATGGSGGGLYAAGGSQVYGGGSFSSNTAASGGGIYGVGATLVLYGTDVDGNQASAGNGGGIYVTGGCLLEAVNLGLSDNTATGSGGGLYRSDAGGSALVYHATIHGNDANAPAGQGGGVYNVGSAMVISASIVANNTASAGSGIYGGGSGVAVDYTLRWNNTYAGSVSVSHELVGDPRFRDSSNLLYDSPAIDAVPMAASDVEFDYILDPRQSGFYARPGYSWICAKDMGRDEYIVLPKVGAGVPTPPAAALAPAESLTYTFVISNASENWSGINTALPRNYGPGSGYTETITITLSSTYPDWSQIGAIGGDAVNVAMLAGRAAAFELRPGGIALVSVRVTVPPGTFANTEDQTFIHYDAQLWQRPGLTECSNPGLISGDGPAARTLVKEYRDFVIAPDNFGAALPGQTLTYTHVITNIGNITDTYSIRSKVGYYAVAEIAEPAPPSLVTLAPQQSAPIVISVTIRPEAAGGLVDVSSAIAQSNGDPALEKAAANNTAISYTTGTRYVSLGGQDSLVTEVGVNYPDNNCTQPLSAQPCRTIQQAIDQAAAGDLIKIDQGVYTDVVTTTIGSQVITQTAFVNESVILQGGYDMNTDPPGWDEDPPNHISHTTTLDPQGLGRALYIAGGVTVTLDRLVIHDGAAEGAGGGVYNAGSDLTLNAVRIYDGAAGAGGALYHGGGLLVVQNSLLHANSAITDGGAIYVYGGAAILQNDTFYANAAGGNGGAVYVAGGSLAVTNTIVATNTSSGGAIHGSPATAALAYNLYYDNTVSNTGGGIPAPSVPPDVLADPRFVDTGAAPPDLRLLKASPAREAGDPATDTGLMPLDYANNPRLLGLRVDVGAYEYVIEPRVELEPDYERTVSQGNLVTYTHTLTNTGDLTDTFTLTWASSQGWGRLVTSSPITLTPDLTATVVVTVAVPSGGTGGMRDVTVVTATSGLRATVFDTAVDTTTVAMLPGLEFAPDRAGSADPGTTITYTHLLTNTGDGPDTFVLTHTSSLGWPVTYPASIDVGYGQTVPVVVSVTVPANAISGTLDTTIITATSVHSATVSRRVTDTTTVSRTYGVRLLPPGYVDSTNPGVPIVYLHTLTNLGNYTDTFDLTSAGEPGWGTLLPVGPVTLAGYQATVVTLTVTPPAGSGGLSDVTLVTATHSVNPAVRAVVTDTTTANRVVLVELEPNNYANAEPGATVLYTHVLTNAGNGQDTFTVTLSSGRGWPLSLLTPPVVTLNAGQSASVVVSLTVPLGTAGQTDVITITATSWADSSRSASAQDVTNVGVRAGVQFAPDRAGTATPGTPITYTHTLTNTGNAVDLFTFSAASSRGWMVELPPSALLVADEVRTVVISITAPGGTFSGTLDTTVITVASSISPSLSASVTDTTTVGRVFGVAFAPSYSRTTGPATTVVYTHVLTNTGNYTDAFTLQMSSSRSWSTMAPPGPVTLAAGQAAPVVVTVTVPGSAISGTVDTTVITATSQGSAAARAIVTDTTRVFGDVGVILAPDNWRMVDPGTIIYTHVLTNAGSDVHTFDLSVVSGHGWPVVILAPASPVTLAAGAAVPVSVSLTVPPGARGTTDVVTVTARSQTIPAIFDIATDTSVVSMTAGVVLEPDNTASAVPAMVVTYTHTLTNTGDGQDTFDLVAASSQGWLLGFSPASVTLSPGASCPVTVTIQVPTGVLSGVVDTTFVTATSRFNPAVFDTATDTTRVVRRISVLLEPDRAGIAFAGMPVTYTHRLTNTGDGPDVFTITLTSSQGWPVVLVSPVSPVALNAGESVAVVIRLQVPGGALSDTVDTTVVTATSSVSPTVWARVVDTTTLGRVYGVSLVPSRSRTTGPGTTVVYTHTLTNLGNYTDTFTLIRNSSQPAWVTMSPLGPLTLGVGGSATLVVTVTVPAGVLSDTVDTTAVTASSSGGPQATVTDTTTISMTAGVTLAPNNTNTGGSGALLTYMHTLRNDGNGQDTFDLAAASSQGWLLGFSPASVTLLPGASCPVTVTIQVPTGVLSGVVDTTVVTATSRFNPAVFDTATDTTRAVRRIGVLLEPDRAGIAFAGAPVTYTHGLTNTGDGPDVFTITLTSSQGWPVVLVSPALSPVPLSAGQAVAVVIRLQVPGGALSGTVDTTVITATSQMEPSVFDTATDTTTVVIPAPGVALAPPSAVTAYTGTTALHMHVLTNTGNIPDTFTLQAVSDQGWVVNVVPPTVSLPAGGTSLIEVRVTVPTSALSGTVDTTVVTATSQTDGTAYAVVVDTTTVAARPGWSVYLPLVLRNYVRLDGPDLVIANISVSPPLSGQPVIVSVTVLNQGTQPVAYGNNFYVDFYVGRAPARLLAGDIAWGVQGVWFGVGQSRVLTATYVFTQSCRIYAQADTDNSVAEADESNNIAAVDLILTSVGIEGAPVEPLPTPAAPSQPADRPRPTPTPVPQ